MSDLMTLQEAREAIEEILEQVPDHLLPRPDKIEPATEYYGPCVWFGGTGWHIGSGKKNRQHAPIDWGRDSAIAQLIDRESAHRYERKWWLDIREFIAATAEVNA